MYDMFTWAMQSTSVVINMLYDVLQGPPGGLFRGWSSKEIVNQG